MPRESCSIEIGASCRAVFDLVHDYDRRLEWDSMLSQARLLAGATEADVGVRSRCVGTWKSAFLALETEYVQFEPGRVAAVKLTNRPAWFERFAATIRHEAVGDDRSKITYIYSFQARPRFLAPLLEPIMRRMLAREVHGRLRSLRTFLERGQGIARRPAAPPGAEHVLRRSGIVVLLAAATACNAGPTYVPRNGDIVFHTSRSSQSLAVQRATHSKYSHMGVVYVESGEASVYEAVQPVRLTPLSEWVRRGAGGRFVAKRLRNADALLTPENLKKLKAEGRRFRGKGYDLYFEWSDERIYCSELVWKMYQRALGIEVGRTQRLADLDLSNPEVQAKIRERWKGAPPVNEIVISPAAVFESEHLVTVHSR